MAETRQERIERIALRDAERKAKEQSFIKKGLPTLGWMAGLALPGAGITDVAGLYPEDMSGSGVMMPSMGRNIADKNYLDALYQGMGLFGDAAYASIPFTGPMGALVGTTLKAGSAMGKAGRVSKAQELINQGKASAGTADATKKMVAETKIPEGKVVDVRKNLNSSFDDPELEKFKAQTIHDVKTLKDGSVSGSESSIGTGSAISYDPAVTLKSNGTPIELKVNQVARDQIASKTKPKFPMAAVRGIHDDVDIFEPDLVLGFNPMRHNVFVDESGYGVKSIKNGKATIVDNDVMVKLDNPDAFRVVEGADGQEIKLYDDIEYYSVDDLPATNNPSEVKGIAALPESEDYITAYHGSGADFDEFDIGKIGTGEGVQAFGHGLYFAEAEKVGKYYKDVLGTVIEYDGKPIWKGTERVGTTGDEAADAVIARQYRLTESNDPKDWMDHLDDEMQNNMEYGSAEQYQASLDRYLTLRPLVDKIKIKDTGKLYETKLKVEPNELFDLDKRLNKQNKAVKEKISSVLDKRLIDLNPDLSDPSHSVLDQFNPTDTLREAFDQNLAFGLFDRYGYETIGQMHGHEIRASLSAWLGPENLSKALNSAGIKGNKYKDEFSRGKDGGTSNFVIFDDRVIDISKKYGISIPMAGAMLMAEDYKNTVEAEEFNQGGEVENDVSAYLRFYQYAKDAGLQFPEAVAAQASLESGHGKSDLAIYQNNVLGIKPDDGSQASESYDTLEYINGEPVVINDLFRTFDSQEDSFAGYKDKIDKPRYEKAKGSGTPEDYLMAIDEAGYATDPNYAEKTIDIMNRYSSYL